MNLPTEAIHAPIPTGCDQILSATAIDFLTELHHRFDKTRRELLERRTTRQAMIDAGRLPDFLPETETIRNSTWQVAPTPPDLLDRRVEITGPVDRKMIINALNSGASTFMADFEDSNSPTWQNVVTGQLNLQEAIRGTIRYKGPDGKEYSLGSRPAVLLVRPRGWHLVEKNTSVNGEPMSASLFDFGLYFFHNAKALLEKRSGPYFYLPKMQSHLEARLWNDVFVFAQEYIGVPRGTIRATVLIETILAAFEMDEILYELRDHSSGLNCGRWDYIFSFIKVFHNNPGFVLPDRAQVTMDRHFLNSYVELLIQTCHRRGIHAIGGMAAQIPIKNDPAANEAAFDKVRRDKLREVKAGHDGAWVAHPGLIPVVKQVFDDNMPGPNQIERKREDVRITAADLLSVPEGTITEEGLRLNIDVGIQYLESWLRGSGCVPIYNLMEDAATAEISRTQVWQWLHHSASLKDGRPVTLALIREVTEAALRHIRSLIGPERYDAGKFPLAARIFEQMITSHTLPEFLTLAAYPHI